MIKAKVIAGSISKETEIAITTFELEYPRYIHSEFMTHRLFSRNAASSRAIPIHKMIKLVRDNPVVPLKFGSNRPGMQAGEELSGWRQKAAETAWNMAKYSALNFVEILDKVGLHKQISNRILEPFSHIKVIMTATELSNFFWLRDHADAQPEIKELASKMLEAVNEYDHLIGYAELEAGEWHLPYIHRVRDEDGVMEYSSFRFETSLSLEEARKVSASCCGQVSYRLMDQSVDKALSIYKRLVESTPVHASPFEHQATPIDPDNLTGVTHRDMNGDWWSGNLRGFVQFRQLIPNNVKKG